MTRYTKLAVGLQFLQVNLQGEDGREERVREEIENRGSGGEWGRRGRSRGEEREEQRGGEGGTEGRRGRSRGEERERRRERGFKLSFAEFCCGL